MTNDMKADCEKEAVIVSQWCDAPAIALGNEEKEEWIISSEVHYLDRMV